MVSQIPRFSELVQHLVQAHELEIMEVTQVLTMKLDVLEAELEALRRLGVGQDLNDLMNGDASPKVSTRRTSRRSSRDRFEPTSEPDSLGSPRSAHGEKKCHRRRSRNLSPAPPAPDKENDCSREVNGEEAAAPETPVARTEAGGPEEDMQGPSSPSPEPGSPDESPKSQGAEKRKSRRKSRTAQLEELPPQEDFKVAFKFHSEASADKSDCDSARVSPSSEPLVDRAHKNAQASPRRSEGRGRRRSSHEGIPQLKRKHESQKELWKTDDEEVSPPSSLSPLSPQVSPLSPQVSPLSPQVTPLPPFSLPPSLPDTKADSQLPAAMPGSVHEDREERLESVEQNCTQLIAQGSKAVDDAGSQGNAAAAASAAASSTGACAGGSSSSSSSKTDPSKQPASEAAQLPGVPEKFEPQAPSAESLPATPSQPLHKGGSLSPRTAGPALLSPQDVLGCPDLSMLKLASEPRMTIIGLVDANSRTDSHGQRRVTWCMAPAMGNLGSLSQTVVGVDSEGHAPEEEEDQLLLELHPVWAKNARRSIISASKSTGHFRSMTRKMSQEELEEAERSCLDKWLSALISRPGSRGRLAWDILGMALIGHDLVAIPLQVFDPPANVFSTIMSWFTIIFWTLDIPSSFFVGFHNEGLVEMRLERIARHYAKTWLTFDIAVITTDWLISVAGAISASLANNSVSYMRVGRALRFLRLLRLLRIMKVHGVLNDIIEMVQSESLLIVLGIAKLLCFIIVINHLLACFWYGVGSIDFDQTWVKANGLEGRELGYRYATALHWSLTQFTPASMEVTPENTAERFFTISVIVFAMVTFSSFISSVTNATTRLRNLNSETVQAHASLRQYLAENKVSTTLMGRIWGCLNQLMLKSKRRLHEKDVTILQLLPWSLKAELQEQVYTPILVVHPFFAHYVSLDTRSCRKIYQSCLTEVSLGIGQEQFNTQQTAVCMLFVLSGMMSYTKADQLAGIPPVMVSMGCWVSEAAMWVKWKHNGQLLATTHAELLALNIGKAHEVMEQREHAAKYAKRFVKFFKDHRDLLCDTWADMDVIGDFVQKAFSEDEVVTQAPLAQIATEEGRSLFSQFMPGQGFKRGSQTHSSPTTLGGRQSQTSVAAGAGGRRPSLMNRGLFGGWQSNALAQLAAQQSDAGSSSGSDSTSESGTESSSGLDDEDEEKQENEKDGKELSPRRATPTRPKRITEVLEEEEDEEDKETSKADDAEKTNGSSDSQAAAKKKGKSSAKVETPVVVVTDAGDMAIQEAD